MTREEVLQMAKTTNDAKTIQMILDFSNNELLLTLLDNPNLTKDNRKYIIDHADFTEYDISNILEELSESKMNSNKLLVANHKACTPELLNKMANNTDNEEVLLAIIQNKHCSTDIILNTMDKSSKLRKLSFDVLLDHDLSEEQILSILETVNYYNAGCLFAISHKNCTSNILEHISESNRDEEICDKVLEHKLVNVNTLVNYIKDTHWVRNPTKAWNKLNELFPDVITTEFIDELLLNKDIRIKEKILAHKNCSIDTIIKVSMERSVSYMHEDEVISGLKNRNLTTQQLMRLVQETDICKTSKGSFILDLDNCTSEIFEIFVQKNLDNKYNRLEDIINHKNFPVELIPKVINLSRETYKLIEKRFKDTINIYDLSDFKYVENSDAEKLVENIDSVDTLIHLVHNKRSEAALNKLTKMSLTEKNFEQLVDHSCLYDIDRYHSRFVAEIIEMVLNHKNCTITTIYTVLTNAKYYIEDKEYKIIFDKLKDLTVDQIKLLYTVENYKIRNYILSLSNCPLELLLDSITDCDNVNKANIIIESLKTKELTEEHIVQLSKCKHWSFRAFAARHVLCPVNILNELAEDKDSTVQSAVASNPNCPIQTLLKIAAKVKEVISNDRISGEILTNLYNVCDKSYYMYIAKNPNCPADIRKQIEAKNIKFNNILFVRTESGLNADGFDVEVYENNEPEPTRIFRTSYRYGYTASYNPSWATEQKPFTTDILVDLVNKYNIDKITVGAGTFVFSGKSMTEDDCKKFVKDYIRPNSILSKLYDA